MSGTMMIAWASPTDVVNQSLSFNDQIHRSLENDVFLTNLKSIKSIFHSFILYILFHILSSTLHSYTIINQSYGGLGGLGRGRSACSPRKGVIHTREGVERHMMRGREDISFLDNVPGRVSSRSVRAVHSRAPPPLRQLLTPNRPWWGPGSRREGGNNTTRRS